MAIAKQQESGEGSAFKHRRPIVKPNRLILLGRPSWINAE
jgi:hypothetical protein